MTMRNKFRDLCSAEEMPSRALRPLCPTRWSVRLSAVDALLSQYDQARDTLGHLAGSSSHISLRAAGLEAQMDKEDTFVALCLARQCLQPLDRLCLLAQRKDVTVSELFQGLEGSMQYFQSLRSNADDAIAAALMEASKLELTPMELPRRKRAPKRYDEGAAGYHPATPSERIRTELLMVLDAITSQLQQRFDQEGLKEVHRASLQLRTLLEKVLLEEVSTAELTQMATQLKSWPPELKPQDLGAQLHVFRGAATFTSLSEAVTAYTGLGKAEYLLPQVKLLLHALLVSPASTATPERSFSALRRLKT